jgi:rfaE bifunctional protein kinase chain/domain
MQMLRVDEETDIDLSSDESIAFLNLLNKLVAEQSPDIIILQDYNKGVLTTGIINSIIEMADKASIPIAVDPKKKNFTSYRKITLFKPNLKEISEGLKLDIDPKSIESLRKAAEYLHHSQELMHLMVTLSENGIFISSNSSNARQSICIPAEMRSIADVSGAGDTVISVAALCLACGTDPVLMASLANLAGGLVCEKPGVVPIDKNQLLAESISVLT